MNSAKIEKSNRKYDIKALNQRMYQIIKSNPDVPQKMHQLYKVISLKILDLSFSNFLQ